jgi:hypothetical protein
MEEGHKAEMARVAVVARLAWAARYLSITAL